LRDYLYFPLGGNRRGKVRSYLNLFIVMFLGGLWHGAAWSYAVWGTFHGTALAAERFCKSRIRLPQHWLVDVLCGSAVFSFVTLAWLLFKLPRIEDVFAYLGAMMHNSGATRYLIVACVLTYSVPVILYYCWNLLQQRLPAQIRKYEFLVFGVLLVAIVLNSGSPQKFIYFQF